MKIFKYFFEFTSIISLFCIFKIVGLRNASNLGGILGKSIGPLFRSKNIIKKKAKFISGPFTNMMFEILEKQKSKLKIIVGNIVTTISDNTNYLYRSV